MLFENKITRIICGPVYDNGDLDGTGEGGSTRRSGRETTGVEKIR